MDLTTACDNECPVFVRPYPVMYAQGILRYVWTYISLYDSILHEMYVHIALWDDIPNNGCYIPMYFREYFPGSTSADNSVSKGKRVSKVYKRNRSLPACMEKKKFYGYENGAEAYGMTVHRFRDLASEADAVYKMGKTILVNAEIIDEYLYEKELTSKEYEAMNPIEIHKIVNAADPEERLKELEALKEEITNLIEEERRLLCNQETEVMQKI